jgi:hypothetical protein
VVQELEITRAGCGFDRRLVVVARMCCVCMSLEWMGLMLCRGFGVGRWMGGRVLFDADMMAACCFSYERICCGAHVEFDVGETVLCVYQLDRLLYSLHTYHHHSLLQDIAFSHSLLM